MISAPGGQNKVEVVLAFTTDPSQATSGMQKITAAAKDISAASKSAQQAMSGMRGPGASPNFPSTVAGPGGQRFSYEAYSGAQKSLAAEARSKEQAAAMAAIRGPDKPFSGGLADVAIKGALALAAINSLTKGLETLGDVSKGAGGKVLGLAELIPVIGGPSAGLARGAIQFGERGLRRGIAQAEINYGLVEGQQANRFNAAMQITGARRESESIIAGARGFFGGGVAVPVPGEDERITQAKMDAERARRLADAAAKDRDAFSLELAQAKTGVGVNQQFVDAASAAEREANARREAKNGGFYQKNAAGIDMTIAPILPLFRSLMGGYAGQSPLNGIEEGMSANSQRKDLGRALLTQEQAIRTEKDKQLNADMKMAEYEKARTDILRAQAAVLKEKYALAKSQERSAGQMTDEELHAVYAAVAQAKAGGYSSLGKDQRDVLQNSPLTSEFAGKEAEKIGAMNPVVQAIRELTGEKSSKDLLKEIGTISANITAKIDVDENALAQKLTAVLGPFIEKLTLIVENQTKNLNLQLESEANKAKKLQDAGL